MSYTHAEAETAANEAKRFVVLIPAYEPDETLTRLVKEILLIGSRKSNFAGVIVVNDGSTKPVSLDALDEVKGLDGVVVLTHPENRGKGGALKTGFRHIYDNSADVGFVVTADADGQHKPGDIFKVAETAISSGNPNIGYRSFADDVPLRSRIGNLTTAVIFKIAAGINVRDTQSGLRTYLREDLPRLMAITAERYEYEFHCLFELTRNLRRPLDQVPIETIYEPGNPTSHFNPLLDSARIYLVFFRYISVSASTSLLDFLFFSILTLFNLPTLPALIFARMGSAPIYFYGMRNFVFKSSGNIMLQAMGTIALMAMHIIFLWRFIDWLKASFNVHPIGAYFSGLLLFYIGNFLIQRFIIYPIRTTR